MLTPTIYYNINDDDDDDDNDDDNNNNHNLFELHKSAH